jgi:PRTRC genetic system protein F
MAPAARGGTVSGRKRRLAAPAPALARAAPALIERARLDAAIPSELGVTPDAAVAALARLLTRSDLLPQAAMVRARARLARNCEWALGQWLKRNLSGLHLLHPKFHAHVGTQQQHHGYEHAAPDPSFDLHIEWYAGPCQAFVIGPQTEGLNALHRGLGSSALLALEYAGWRTLPVFSCAQQLGVASMCMWGGADSLAAMIEDYGLDQEEAEELRQSRLDRSHILAHTPQWVFESLAAQSLSAAALQRIAQKRAESYARSVASAILAVRAFEDAPHHIGKLEEGGAMFVGFAALLRWSELDYTLDVVDTLYSDAMNSGEGFEACGIHAQRLHDEQAFAQWLEEMRVWFELTRAMDELLGLLVRAH